MTELKTFSVILLLIYSVLPLRSLESGPELKAESAILYDFATGRILYEKNADMLIPPASMTKLVTLYLGWQYLENGGSPDEPVEITATGSSFSRPLGSSLMLLEEGQNVTFIEIMKGLAISSGNDAAYALAEHVSGTPQRFVGEMNDLVQSLGYKSMYFEDPDGWSALNKITAREYASFSRDYIRSFPYALEQIHDEKTFTYPEKSNLPAGDARIITPREKKNTNILLGKVDGVDGLKTGYIDESGFNFTATAQRGITRYIAVIMGIRDVGYFEGIELRANEAASLLEYGFRNFKTIDPESPVLISIPLWEGRSDTASIAMEGDPLFTLSVDEMTGFTREIDLPEELIAPLAAGDVVGSVSYRTSEALIESYPIVVTESVDKGNLFKVLWHKMVRFYRNLTTP